MTLKWVHGMSFVIWTISLVQWLNVSGNMGQTQTITITVLMQTWPIPSEYTQGIGIRQTIPGQTDKEQSLTWYIFPVPAPRRTGVCASADLLAVFHTIYSLQSMYTGQKKNFWATYYVHWSHTERKKCWKSGIGYCSSEICQVQHLAEENGINELTPCNLYCHSHAFCAREGYRCVNTPQYMNCEIMWNCRIFVGQAKWSPPSA